MILIRHNFISACAKITYALDFQNESDVRDIQMRVVDMISVLLDIPE